MKCKNAVVKQYECAKRIDSITFYGTSLFQNCVAFSKYMNCNSLELILVGEWAWGCVFSKIILFNELLRAVFFEHFLAKIGEKRG